MANLVVQTAFVGDLILTVPFLLRLKESYPDQELHLVCRKGLGEAFCKLGLVDYYYEMDKKNPRSLKEIQKILQGIHFNNIFCPHRSIRSAFFVKGLKANNKIGYRHWWNRWVFNIRVERPMHYPEPIRLLSLLAAENSDFQVKFKEVFLRQDLVNPSEKDTIDDWDQIPIPQWAKGSIVDRLKGGDELENLFASQGETIALAPGSVWNTKRWTLEGYTELAKKLVEQKKKVILVGAPNERNLCDEINKVVPQAINLAGKTSILQMFHVLKSVDLVVANDSAAAHFASVVDTPVVSIFGPTTLSLGYRPWNEKMILLQKNLKCRPCGLHGSKVCPIKTHECMTSIQVDEVFAAVIGLIEQTKKRASKN